MMNMSSMVIWYVLLTLVNAGAWYGFFYYSLYYIKKEVATSRAALVLLLLFSLAIMTCPIILTVLACCVKMALFDMNNMQSMM